MKLSSFSSYVLLVSLMLLALTGFANARPVPNSASDAARMAGDAANEAIDAARRNVGSYKFSILTQMLTMQHVCEMGSVHTISIKLKSMGKSINSVSV